MKNINSAYNTSRRLIADVRWQMRGEQMWQPFYINLFFFPVHITGIHIYKTMVLFLILLIIFHIFPHSRFSAYILSAEAQCLPVLIDFDVICIACLYQHWWKTKWTHIKRYLSFSRYSNFSDQNMERQINKSSFLTHFDLKIYYTGEEQYFNF